MQKVKGVMNTWQQPVKCRMAGVAHSIGIKWYKIAAIDFLPSSNLFCVFGKTIGWH